MLFPRLDIRRFGEADVRAEIIDRLLAHLGYRSGTENNIVRELTLRYPKVLLGRRKPTDPVLQGRADYVVEVRGDGRWTIEAKPASSNISAEDIEQAYSYAVHPEVQAFFYVVCNGVTFRLFRTFDGPNAPPLVEVEYDQLDEKLSVIANLLSPTGFVRARRLNTVDVGVPLAEGLGSKAVIVGGYVQYSAFRASVPIPEYTTRMFDGYRVQIAAGTIGRDSEGHIAVELQYSHFHRMLEVMTKELGLESIRYLCADQTVSTNLESPSIFEGTFIVEFRKGQRLFDVSTMQTREMLIPGTMTMYTSAVGVLKDIQFEGKFFGQAIWKFHSSPLVMPPIDIELEGSFAVNVQ